MEEPLEVIGKVAKVIVQLQTLAVAVAAAELKMEHKDLVDLEVLE